MEKYVFFGFTGEPTCFGHALLNARDMADKGYEVQVVLEGASTGLLPELWNGAGLFSSIFRDLVEQGRFAGVCRACANKLGTLDFAEEKELPILDEMSGHPSFAAFLEKGFKIITI